jgi:hypothetical protein
VYGDNLDKINTKSDNNDVNILLTDKVKRENKGYLKDNRPLSDADPYLVISKIFETCCINFE